MHEISLLENVLGIIENYAKTEGFSRVKKIGLEIGKLSCVEEHALRFGFDVVMKNTLAENAELNISQTEGTGVCQQCGKTVRMEALYDPCSECGFPRVLVTGGREMKIKELIVV